jgi:very-short-patch-repair endonuclease
MPVEPDVDHAIGGKRRVREEPAGQDRAIAELAQRQHGVVARRQLLEAGLSRRAIDHRMRGRRLQAVHRGVYAVGHSVLSTEGRWMAAVLAGGMRAALSHRSAGALWGLRTAGSPLIDVTVPRGPRPRRGIRFHESSVPPDELTALRGIPVTSVPRTLLDLAAILPRQAVERAIEEAEVLRLTDSLSLADMVDRYPRRRGMVAVRAILAVRGAGTGITRSELEARFLSLLDQGGLPRPAVNRSLRLRNGWIEADCVWARQRLIVELDGHAFHSTRAAFDRDRSRDRVLQAEGWRVIRVTWRQLHDETAALVADLRGLLCADGYASSLA